MRARGWLSAVVFASFSLLDVVLIKATVPRVDRRPILPLDVTSPRDLVAVYAVVVLVLLGAYLLLRRSLSRAPGARALVVVCVLFLGVRGALAKAGAGGAFDRARAARTAAKLKMVDEHVRKFFRTHGRLPQSLAELQLPGSAVVDEWRQSIKYEAHTQQQRYRLWSDGAPLGKPGLQDYYRQLTIEGEVNTSSPDGGRQ